MKFKRAGAIVAGTAIALGVVIPPASAQTYRVKFELWDDAQPSVAVPAMITMIFPGTGRAYTKDIKTRWSETVTALPNKDGTRGALLYVQSPTPEMTCRVTYLDTGKTTINKSRFMQKGGGYETHCDAYSNSRGIWVH